MVLSRDEESVKGRVNRLIDDLVHPHFKKYPALILLDGLLHAAVEDNPEVSFRKFVRYNAPKILRYLISKRK